MIARFLPLVVGAFLACSASAGAEKPKPTPKPLTEEQVRQTLERIVIPTLTFREASFREAIDFLRKEAQRLDPKKRGVPFHVRIEPPPPDRGPSPSPSPSIPETLPPPAVPEAPFDPEKGMITISLTKIPLIEALKYVTGLAHLKFRIRPDGVHIVALHDRDPMFTREIRIPTRFAKDSLQEIEALKKNPREFLIAHGVLFDEPAAAILNDQATRLTVHNTKEQIDLIETLLESPPEIPISPAERYAQDRSAVERLQQKMNTIILPEVRLANVSLRSAVDTLKQLAQQHDRRSPKGKRGINLILRSPEDEASATEGSVAGLPGLSGPAAPANPAAAAPDTLPADNNPQLLKTTPLITYTATKVTLGEVVAAVARQAGYDVNVQPYFVSIQKKAPPGQLFTREWIIPPNAIPRTPTGPRSEAEKRTGIADRERAKAWLTGGGVTFNGQASAVYIARSSRLIVRDTEEKLREIDELIAAYWREHAAAEKARKAKRR